MKIDLFKITQEELNIMDILWDSDRLVTTAQLSRKLSERCNETVKSSSINRFCADLAQKGFISRVQISSRNYHTPLIQRDEYQFVMAKLLLDKLFKGNVEELVTVLLRDMDMTKDTLLTLKSMLASAQLPSEEAELKEQEQEVPEQSTFINQKQMGLLIIPTRRFFYFPKNYIQKKRLYKAQRPGAG